MNESRVLIDNFWILKEDDRERYAKVKQGYQTYQKFIREQLGWKVIFNEKLLKVEKKPDHAESYMGIQKFSEILDYEILCVLLMFLEEKEEGQQFLLTDLIRYIESNLKDEVPIDLKSYSNRKSVVRALNYAEEMKILKVNDGKSDNYGNEEVPEVLYENTGYSRYFATTFPIDISGYDSWKDFENPEFFLENDNTQRMNRIYRGLLAGPMLHYEDNNHPDLLYIRNQNKRISDAFFENVGGNLEVNRNSAFLMMGEGNRFGQLHPTDATLPELVLYICSEICSRVVDGTYKKLPNECVHIKEDEFREVIDEYRQQWQHVWSKGYREKEQDNLYQEIIEYMELWKLAKVTEEYIIVYPSVAKVNGTYPKDMEN